MKSTPKVSVVTVCYNQEKYIEAALKSFVMQKTDFPFEVIVSDDCSTDKTPQIIKRYAEKYPDIIKPVLRKKNLGVVKNNIEAIKATTGTYVALCEGDDFWTDPEKLQRQADFLDTHSDYAVCFHPVRVFFEGDVQPESIYPTGADRPASFTTKSLLQRNFIQTNSVMYRRPKSYDNLPSDVLPLDWYLHLYHAKFGKIGFIDRVMGAYRRHPGGLWWDSYAGIHKIWKKYGAAHLSLYIAILNLYGDNPAYAKIIRGHIINLLDSLRHVDEKYQERLLKKAIAAFPGSGELYIHHLLGQINGLDQHAQEQAKIIQHYVDLSERLTEERKHQEQRIVRLTEENRQLNAKLLIRLEGAVRRQANRLKRNHT
ncbi:MAG TPA: glycosyltransferase [Candidatus Saccharimonadales bacterium]|nr:glycosyltransferase [Candidatus Saccharimonadales bacterium]